MRHRGRQIERRALSEGRRLGLLLAIVLSAALLGCSSEQGSDGQTAARATDGAQPAVREEREEREKRVSPRLTARFALLRTPADGLPPAVAATVKVPVPGMDWSLAQRVPLALPGTYWLVPGARHLCLVATSPGSPAVGTVCARVEQALRHGVANTSLDPASETRTIVGVVPDGTRTALVRTDTATTTVPVRRGSFVLRDAVPAPPDLVTLR